MADNTTTHDPAAVAELLGWAREMRPAMAETTEASIRRLVTTCTSLRAELAERGRSVARLIAENASLRARIADLEQQILVALGEARR